jgi:hypothetical protein
MKLLNQKSNIIVFPTEINELGEAKGDIIPIQDFFLNGKEPMIGTNINPNIPFINSYFNFDINGGGLIFDVKEQQTEPYANNLEGEIPTDSDFGFEETKETTTPVSTDAKADIERRRKEDLKYNEDNEPFTKETFTDFNLEVDESLLGKYEFVIAPGSETDEEVIIVDSIQEGINRINAKYDKELAALEEKEVTPEENKVNQQLKENEINCSNNGEGIKLNPKPKFNFKK